MIFFPSHAVIPRLFVCHMAHRTYFSSLSLIGKTADCLNVFNFLVPRRGFLWIEPLSYARNMIDVFHINLLILWLQKCNFLLKFLLMATRQHLRVFFTQSLSHIQITLYSVLGTYNCVLSKSCVCVCFGASEDFLQPFGCFVYASKFIYVRESSFQHVCVCMLMFLCVCFIFGVRGTVMDMTKVNGVAFLQQTLAYSLPDDQSNI